MFISSFFFSSTIQYCVPRISQRRICSVCLTHLPKSVLKDRANATALIPASLHWIPNGTNTLTCKHLTKKFPCYKITVVVFFQVYWQVRCHNHKCLEPQENSQKGRRGFPWLCSYHVQCHSALKRHWM